MKRSVTGTVWFGICAVILAAVTLFCLQIQNLRAWPLPAVLLAGHLFYFFGARGRPLQLVSVVVQGVSFIALVLALLLLNAEGNTWGNSGAYIGFFLLLPAASSFYGAAKFRSDFRFQWYALSAGIVGILFTVYQLIEASRLRAAYANSERMYWGPESELQYLGIALSLLLLLLGLKSVVRKKRAPTSPGP